MRSAWPVGITLLFVGGTSGKLSGDLAVELGEFEARGGKASPDATCSELLQLCESKGKGCLAHDVYCTENPTTSEVCAELQRLCERGSPTACAAAGRA